MINSLKLLTFITVLVISSSCAGLMERRTFIDEMDRESDGFFRPGDDFQILSGDSGEAYRSREEINKRTPASRKEYEQMKWDQSINDELKAKERSLTKLEYAKYRNYDDYFESNSDRIYYLTLSPSERNQYLENKGIGSSSGYESNEHAYVRHYQPGIKQTINEYFKPTHYENEIKVGMSKEQVEDLWGRPAQVEVAGDPRYGNERWSFYHQGKMSYVFFEKGEVNGWSID